MTKLINDIGNWLISSGALVTAFIFAWKYLKPILKAKEEHTSTLQSKELWDLLMTVADASVSAMVSQPMIGGQKFEAAVKATNEAMLKQGYDVDNSTIQNAVQAAYEKSDLTGNDQPIVSEGAVSNISANKITGGQLKPELPSTDNGSSIKANTEKVTIPENSLPKKGIPTNENDLKSIAVQTPTEKSGDDNDQN